MKKNIMYNIPNLLSYYRIAVVPVLALFFYIGGATATWINVFLFFCACVSDLLDGIIARQTGQITLLGKFIDSTSDKILVGGTMLLLVGFDRLTGIWIIPALLIFSREIFIAGLREFLGLYNITVPISWLGKWKATIQMISSGFLIAGDYGDSFIPYSFLIGKITFLVATVMTLISAWDYMKKGYATIKTLEEGKQVS